MDEVLPWKDREAINPLASKSSFKFVRIKF